MAPDTQRVRCSSGGRKDRRWTQSPSGRHLRTSRLGSLATFCSAGPKKNRNVCKRGFPNARTRCVCRALRPARRPGAFDAIDLELTAKKVVIVWGDRKRKRKRENKKTALPSKSTALAPMARNAAATVQALLPGIRGEMKRRRAAHTRSQVFSATKKNVNQEY